MAYLTRRAKYAGGQSLTVEVLQMDHATTDPEVPAVAPAVADEVLVEDVLVEEVSIDGMCGVY